MLIRPQKRSILVSVKQFTIYVTGLFLKGVGFLPMVRHKSPRSLARSGSLTPNWNGSPGCTEHEAGRSRKGGEERTEPLSC